MCPHEHASCKTTVFKRKHKERARVFEFCLFVCFCVGERDFQTVCAVRRSQCSSSLYPAQNSQPENCVSDVMSWLPKGPWMLFFSNSHSVGLAWLTNQAVCVVYMQTQTLAAPPLITLSCAFMGVKMLSLRFPFRVSSKMFTKTHSQLFLKTSKFALSVNLPCMSAL